MADSTIAVTAGSGTSVDTRTEGTNGNHRQVIVIGDPATNAGVAPVDVTAGLKVYLGVDNDVTNAGTFATQATLQAGTAGIGKLTANTGVDIGDVDVTSVIPGTAAANLGKAEDATHTSGDVGVMALAVRNDTLGALAGTDGDYSPLQINSTGSLYVEASGSVQLQTGTNTIGNVGLIPQTSGGLTIFRSIDIDETEEEIKATAGQLFSISAFNTTAAPLFLKFYNLTAANTTVGTSTPVLTFVVPANAVFIWNNDIGFAFSTAMTVACTTAVADADTGAPSANACIINIGYA